ncbi:MAG: SDR family oxidoreductase [Ruminococcaceae bacterium]|nr:SDR family oxidoreductase [Oscillospiraceae bacterium]
MKRVLITGGSRGIGAAIVRAFTEKGHRVAFLYHTNHAAATRVAAETGALPFSCDVSDPKALGAIWKDILFALGGAPEVLINNAGISDTRLSRDVDDATWRRLLDTNLSAAFYLSRMAQVPMIGEKWGRIVNVGSMWGKIGASMEVAYSTAKAGLRGLTMSLAKELGPSGITVNCVEPGVIDTDMNSCHDEATLAALAEETPLGRLGTPEDVAAAVLFLASSEAAFITGQCLGVDGGFAI